MTDRELLGLAAKAAGYVIQGDVDKMIVQPGHYSGGFVIDNAQGGSSLWNPLTDDGDALRLAVKLGASIYAGTYKVACEIVPQEDGPNLCVTESYQDDAYAATRRAIVRAAAEIGAQL